MLISHFEIPSFQVMVWVCHRERSAAILHLLYSCKLSIQGKIAASRCSSQ